MKQSGKCPRCGCTDIIADAKAMDHGHLNSPLEMTVATYRNPQALFFKGQQATNVSAWVCAGCGFVEYYADTPDKLKLSDA
jgi:predicted nucleic-acid-binding Zn-ribbon protein